MKKIKFILLVILGIVLTGCGNKTTLINKTLSTKDLNIKDFAFNAEKSKCSGFDCYIVEFTNNSKYDLISVNFKYKVKDDVTEEMLSLYDEFMKDHDWFIDEDDSKREVTLRGNTDELIEKGSTTRNVMLTIGYNNYSWYDTPSKEQFDLMELNEIQIGVIGKDKKLYLAYYSFVDKSWRIDETTIDLNVWPKTELSKLIPVPDFKYYAVIDSDEEDFSFYAVGVSKDDYFEYVNKLKESGFVNIEQYEDYIFEATNKENNGIEIWYEENIMNLTLSLTKDSDD